MDKNNRILIHLCIGVMLAVFLVGCNKTNKINTETEVMVDFPKNDDEYPKNDIVLINGEVHKLKDIEKAYGDVKISGEIEIRLKKENHRLEVVLPQRDNIHLWDVGLKEHIDLISYSKNYIPIENEKIKDGESATIQKFVFEVPSDDNINILFKWSNVNDIEKSFKEKEENYLLKIKVSHE